MKNKHWRGFSGICHLAGLLEVIPSVCCGMVFAFVASATIAAETAEPIKCEKTLLSAFVIEDQITAPAWTAEQLRLFRLPIPAVAVRQVLEASGCLQILDSDPVFAGIAATVQEPQRVVAPERPELDDAGRVCAGRVDSLDDLVEARLWLESSVVRVACARATEADLAALEANVDEAERLFLARRYEDKIDVHVEFHNVLARCTRNGVTVMLMGALMQVMRDFAHAVGGERDDQTIAARRRFLARMRARDADGAVATMAEHLESLRKRYRARVRDRGPRRALN